MGYTISEKIMARASGNEQVHSDDIVWVDIDRAMMDDVLGPRLEIDDRLREMGVDVWDPDKVVIISDHYTPPANLHQANIVKFTREWAAEHKISRYYEFAGPCHQVMVEHGHVLPGSVVVGTDSHTCTYGALASFATGVGSTEMAGVLATGQTWMKVPQTIRVVWNGELPERVMAKDISLKTIGAVGHSGATYKTLEYAGDTIRRMIMDERLCLTNMAVEAGAKAGIVGYDDVTAEYLARFGVSQRYDHLNSDPDAVFCAEYAFKAGELAPQVACPHEVDHVCEAAEQSGVQIHQAYIGSCTGGRYHDGASAGPENRTGPPALGVARLPGNLQSVPAGGHSGGSGGGRGHGAGFQLRRLPGNSLRNPGRRRGVHFHHQPEFHRPDGEQDQQRLSGFAGHGGRLGADGSYHGPQGNLRRAL